MSEEQATGSAERTSRTNAKPAKTTSFSDIAGKDVARKKTGLHEVDRVFGGGIVPGSLILLGGEPGIGKSTLVLQIAAALESVLYCSGEESGEQIKLRMDRLGIAGTGIHFCNATDIGIISATIRETKPTLAIVDSIQTMAADGVPSEAGSVSQVRAITAILLETAKATGIPIIIIGHVTKEGSVAGPKTLEHLVDTVLYLEGERSHLFRMLRSVKNRFGSVDEIGVFEMAERGLLEVADPSRVFLEERTGAVAGTATTIAMEGTRPFFVEVQALVTKTVFGFPQRRAEGFDTNRLQLLIAVLGRRGRLPLGQFDVFVNVAGGFSLTEPAADLAVALAIASALADALLPKKSVVFGEIGLTGELRKSPLDAKRRAEATRFGYTTVIAPPDIKTLADALGIVKKG